MSPEKNAGLEPKTAESEPKTAAYSPSGSGFVPPTPEAMQPAFPLLEIIDLLGKGGMGAVYKARQPGLDRLVAVKILPPEVSQDPAFAERFTREARALAMRNHPNIVGVYDSGHAGGYYYFVMEYLDGVNLRQAMRAGQLKAAEALKTRLPPSAFGAERVSSCGEQSLADRFHLRFLDVGDDPPPGPDHSGHPTGGSSRSVGDNSSIVLAVDDRRFVAVMALGFRWIRISTRSRGKTRLVNHGHRDRRSIIGRAGRVAVVHRAQVDVVFRFVHRSPRFFRNRSGVLRRRLRARGANVDHGRRRPGFCCRHDAYE